MSHNKRSQTWQFRPRRRQPGAACSWLISLLMIIGLGSLGAGLLAQRSVAATQSLGEIRTATPANQTAKPDKPAPAYLPYAIPTRIELPSIKVTSELIHVGKTPEGHMEVPLPPHFDKAAWYRDSPAPGQFGASVIIGHVDSYANAGGSVFYALSKLKPGEQIFIKREDNTTVNFTVQAIRDYGKEALPTALVYGSTANAAELRLITCGGQFNKQTGQYSNNTVVFATMNSASNSTSSAQHGVTVTNNPGD